MFKRLLPILLAVLLVTTAYADIIDLSKEQDSQPIYQPIDVQTKTEDGVALLLKTFEVGPDVPSSDLIEPDLTEDGVEYDLRDILMELLPDGQEKKTATQSVTVPSESDQREHILPLLPESIPYDEAGFIGSLLLDESTIQTEAMGSEAYSYTITETREYPGLVRNDPYLIPKTVGKDGATLTLYDIQWNSLSENDPHPTSYTATAFYKGTVSGAKPTGYTITTAYAGEVVKTIPGNISYTLIYAAKPVGFFQSVSAKTIPWMTILLVLGGIVLLCVLAVTVVYAMGRRKATSNDADDGYETPERRMRIPRMLSEMEDDDDV